MSKPLKNRIEIRLKNHLLKSFEIHSQENICWTCEVELCTHETSLLVKNSNLSFSTDLLYRVL